MPNTMLNVFYLHCMFLKCLTKLKWLYVFFFRITGEENF